MGIAFGLATYYILRWMRVCGASHDQQVCSKHACSALAQLQRACWTAAPACCHMVWCVLNAPVLKGLRCMAAPLCAHMCVRASAACCHSPEPYTLSPRPCLGSPGMPAPAHMVVPDQPPPHKQQPSPRKHWTPAINAVYSPAGACSTPKTLSHAESSVCGCRWA